MRRAAFLGLLLVVAGGYCSKLGMRHLLHVFLDTMVLLTLHAAPLLSEDATNALEGEYIVQLQDHLSEDEGTQFFFLLLC